MTKTKIVNTPVGIIEISPTTTTSTSATVTITKMKDEFIKIANSGTVPVDKLRDEARYSTE